MQCRTLQQNKIECVQISGSLLDVTFGMLAAAELNSIIIKKKCDHCIESQGEKVRLFRSKLEIAEKMGQTKKTKQSFT